MENTHHPNGSPWRNFYGRFKGKTLRPAQIEALNEDLDRLSVPNVSWDVNPDRAQLDLQALFGQKDLWLEIGFGGGEHLVHQARSNPDVGIIGCEPFLNGVAMLLQKLRDTPCENVRIHPGDARHLFDVLPNESVSKAFLLYPDPWPKRRQHKRRFVSHETLDLITRALKPAGEFRFASDIDHYVGWTLSRILPRKDLVWQATRADDWRKPWAEWIRTRYEAKAIREGRVPSYLISRRVA